VQVGTLPAEGVPFPANSVMARELDYVGAFRAAHAFDWAVQALRTRRVDVRPLISAQLPIAEAVRPSSWRWTAAAAPRFNWWPTEGPETTAGDK
jgi:threonine dehydrogenase-like Zn-dependent dehydrogenase